MAAGDQVPAALDLHPHPGFVEGREVRVRPRVVSQLVAQVDDHPAGVGVALQPRPDGQDGAGGAAVVQQGEQPSRERLVPGTVEGQGHLRTTGAGVYQLAGRAGRRRCRCRCR